MSQVGLMLPPGAGLPSAEKDTYVAKEPPGEQLSNDADKQRKPPTEDNICAGASTFCDLSAERENVKPLNNKNHVHANNNNATTNSKPKRHRRGKKRKWKPYFKLTWVERKQLQDREEKRAEKVRADMSASGLTLAPYNTTQFLMDDHNLQEPDYAHIPVGHRVNHHSRDSNHVNGVNNQSSQDSSDDFYSSPEDEEDFLQQQFTETYKSIHAERLSNLSQGELVQELMTLEDRVEALQKTLKAVEERPESTSDPQRLQEQLEKIRVFEIEIQRLNEQNERLKRENEDLRLMLRPGSKPS